ncbi:MAG: hypothetical protein FWF36_06775 [Propionibacteriaceae bacterium]|nr:hypothetical protein [Propionibacteriaceae bacterium]
MTATIDGHRPEMTAAVYFGDDGRFLLFPLAKDTGFARSEVDRPLWLGWDGVSVEMLGQMVWECLSVSAASIGHQPSKVPPFLSASGAKSDRAFVKMYQLVYVSILEDRDHLEAQYWHRRAGGGFSGPPDERPDWTVSLGLDATPFDLGTAVVQVLQAGGADMSAQTGVSAPPDSDDRIGYCEFKAGLLGDYRIAAGQCDDPVEAVTGLLEQVGHTVNDDPLLFVCAITTCSLTCLQEGFLPDYLVEPAKSLGDISGRLAGQDLAAYKADSVLLGKYLAGQFRIIEAPFPPDYFPGTWGPAAEAASRVWWNNLLQGRPTPRG